MPRRKYRFHDGKSGAALAVRVAPRARQDRIAEVRSDGSLRIQLTAAPVGGQANDRLIAFLAKTLGVPRSSIEIVAGKAGRDKLVSILGLGAEAVHERVVAALRQAR